MATPHPRLTVLDHALVDHKIARLRSADTAPPEFRRLVRELAALMAWPLFADLPREDVQVATPLETTTCRRIAGPVTLVPVLRAGLGLMEGLHDLLPEARVGHIGLQRDEETAKASTYYTRLPSDIGEGTTVLVDAMLATGGSCETALSILRDHGCERLTLACLVAVPEGLGRLADSFPDVPIVAAALDRELDTKRYIRPGLGDAGDRIFGTL